MNFEKKLYSYKEAVRIFPDERRIQQTVKMSIDSFYLTEQESLLTYNEFLWMQCRLIRKRWWLLQFLVLFALWLVIPITHGEYALQRIMGIAASLFVILIIPEIWKNRTCQAMEIEAVSYYSLRQIYSARMLLFGIVDIMLVTFFCGLSSAVWHIAFWQLLVQFILPMTVTSCICFGILCSKYVFSETFAIMMCSVWSMVWLLLVLNEKIYAVLSFPIWLTFLGAALLILVFTINRTIHCCNYYWEVKPDGINIR